jgi:hypothetical protein
LELSCYFGSHFETARSDSGPDRHNQIFRSAVEPLTHGVYCFRRDLSHHATPPGMNRGHCAMAGVGDQNGETIGGSDGQPDSRAIRNQGIALALRSRRFYRKDAVRVNLPGSGQMTAGEPSGA